MSKHNILLTYPYVSDDYQGEEAGGDPKEQEPSDEAS